MSPEPGGYDVIVVGAGPAGTAAAEACAGFDLRTLCIEEHGTIGYPTQCAGLLSNAAFAECRVSDRAVVNRVSGARIISAAGTSVSFAAKTTKAVVVDRGVLDREMAENAACRGAEFLLKTSVCGIRGTTLLTRGNGPREPIPFRILIAADGPRSTVARMLGMQRARAFLAGIQAEVRHTGDPASVEIYPDASPHFFGWAIPTAPGRARVGLCAMAGVPALFSTFLERFDAPTVEFVTGTIPLGVMPRTFGYRTLFVGDAAGMAKPTSGGGVYTGVRAARHAAAVAAEACTRDRFDDAFLADYERRWKEDFGSELAWGFRLFEMRQRMGGRTFDDIIRALDDPCLLQTIEEYGDMDRPSLLAKKMLLQPGAFRLIPPLMQAGLQALFP